MRGRGRADPRPDDGCRHRPEGPKLLLLVCGQGKEEALKALLSGKPDPDRSVTALVDHPDLTVLRDVSSVAT